MDLRESQNISEVGLHCDVAMAFYLMNKRLFKEAVMVGIKEVAARAGVSVSVASRALSPRPDKHARVAEETRRRVAGMAQALGYRRNRTAEFLKRGRTPVIGVFLPDCPNRLVADLMFGMAETAGDLSLSFALGLTNAQYRRFIERLDDQSPCGIVSYPYFSLERRTVALLDRFCRHHPMLLLNPEVPVASVPAITLGNREGGIMAGEHLLQRQCIEYAMVGDFYERRAGFAAAMSAAGRDFAWFPGDAAGIAGVAGLAASTTGRIGIFAASDQLALQVMRAIRPTGRVLGREALVVGYDDLDLAAEADPPLTTIHQPFREQGRLAAKKIINLVYGKEEVSEQLVPRLVIRESA